MVKEGREEEDVAFEMTKRDFMVFTSFMRATPIVRFLSCIRERSANVKQLVSTWSSLRGRRWTCEFPFVVIMENFEHSQN